ncbi:MAG: hypothetical protein PUB07_08240 [Clostridia bacterium]|nr:hypothetical protein [Clostridia bacterium]
MYVSLSKNHALFRTPYSDTHDLVQIFRGLIFSQRTINGAIDFMNAGLIQNGKPDYWHIDVPFAISNDETTPCRINQEWIGGNHGHPCVVHLAVKNHDKTYADIGSLWVDGEGTKFTLVSIVDEEILGFVSENIGESDMRYAFKKSIAESLTYISHGVNTGTIAADGTQTIAYLAPAIRFLKKQVVGYQNGESFLIHGGAECDYAEMQEEFEIMNPALVSDALRANRPEGGYTEQPSLAIGKPMLRQSKIYRIAADGTVLCIFNLEKLMDVDFEHCMCVMYQEKIDIYGGGIHRALPGVLPFQEGEDSFDFSMPIALYPGPYPQDVKLTASYWENPAWPPDRFVDVFRDRDGHDHLGFACGYLPILDGEPSVRRENLTFAAHLYRTRKAYPTFLSGGVTKARGVAYKKYFASQTDKTSVYTVPYENQTYIYADCFGGESVTVPTESKARLLDQTGDVMVDVAEDRVVVSGTRGHAVLVVEN